MLKLHRQLPWIAESLLGLFKSGLLIAKVSADRLAAFTARVKELHPYSVPEVVALDVVGGNAEYIEWVKRGGG